MNKKKKKMAKEVIMYVVLILFGLIMVYPLIWMFSASFKTNAEIYGSIRLLPESVSFQPYIAYRGLQRDRGLRFYQI